jgi:hypothetical protein
MDKHHGFALGKRVRIKFKDGMVIIDRFVCRRMPFLFFESSRCIHVRSAARTSHWKKAAALCAERDDSRRPDAARRSAMRPKSPEAARRQPATIGGGTATARSREK